MNYFDRRKKLQKKLVADNLDSFLITDFYNILYLTGFKTLSPHEKEAKVIVTPDTVYFITDTRYETETHTYFQAIEGIQVMIHGPERTFLQVVNDILAQNDILKLGFEKHDLSYAWFEYLQKALPNTELQPISNIVMQHRNQKDQDELALMKQAASYTDECLSEIVSYLHEGVCESDILHRLENWIQEKKLAFSFDPIVAFDKNTALPHYNNKISDAVLGKNSIILIDLGITYQNYCSDITRMFFMGKPSKEQEKAYNDLLEVQNKTVIALKPGTKMETIDLVARNGLTDNGYPSIPHSTGHGVGLEVHEGLRVARTVSDTLIDNSVITIEPGIYYEGKWGMRIEDTVAFVDGKPEILTSFPKELSVL